MDIDLLIAEVQKRPVLWDTTDEEYKDRNRKNTAWIEVAEAVCSEDFKRKQEAEQKVFGKYLLFNVYYITQTILYIFSFCHGSRPWSLTKYVVSFSL